MLGLGTKNSSPRTGKEAGLDQELHDDRLDDRLAVEALDREPLRSPTPHVRDKGGESRAKPFGIGLPKRDQRTAASLHEENCFAAEHDHPRSGHSCGTGAGAPRPGDRGAIRLRRVRRGEDERLPLRNRQIRRPQLAKALDCARQRELRSTEPFDEISAPAQTERLQNPELRVDRAVSAPDALTAYAVARDDSVALEQELCQRSATWTLWL
jgi:hypothetical protein